MKRIYLGLLGGLILACLLSVTTTLIFKFSDDIAFLVGLALGAFGAQVGLYCGGLWEDRT